MSIHVLSTAVKNTQSQKMTRFVLVAMCDFANREGMSYPSVNGIIEWTGMSRAAVQRSLAELRELGEIVAVENVTGGRGRATTYRIMVGLDSWAAKKGPQREAVSVKREREKGALQRLFKQEKGPQKKGLSDGPFTERASEIDERASNGDPLHIEERARPFKPLGTVSPLLSADAGSAESPRAIAAELQDILGVVSQSRNSCHWFLADSAVSRWIGWGATRDLILAVGRSLAAKGRRDIPPNYLDGPISDAIAAAARPMPEPSKDAANGQQSHRSYRGTVNDVFAKLRAEAVRDGRIDPRKHGDPRDGAIDAEPIADGGAASLAPGRIVRANGHGG